LNLQDRVPSFCSERTSHRYTTSFGSLQSQRRPVLVDRDLAHGVEAMLGRETCYGIAAQIGGDL
jgi:hypothetical protein